MYERLKINIYPDIYFLKLRFVKFTSKSARKSDVTASLKQSIFFPLNSLHRRPSGKMVAKGNFTWHPVEELRCDCRVRRP